MDMKLLFGGAKLISQVNQVGTVRQSQALVPLFVGTVWKLKVRLVMTDLMMDWDAILLVLGVILHLHVMRRFRPFVSLFAGMDKYFILNFVIMEMHLFQIKVVLLIVWILKKVGIAQEVQICLQAFAIQYAEMGWLLGMKYAMMLQKMDLDVALIAWVFIPPLLALILLLQFVSQFVGMDWFCLLKYAMTVNSLRPLKDVLQIACSQKQDGIVREDLKPLRAFASQFVEMACI